MNCADYIDNSRDVRSGHNPRLTATKLVGRHQIVLLGLLVLLASPSETAEGSDRIPIWGEINGHSVTLFLDTGSETSGLFRDAVDRIGLRTHTQGQKFFDSTEEFTWIPAPSTWISGPALQKGRALILDRPSFADDEFDGFIGWPGISNLVFRFDMQDAVLSSSLDLPKALDGWNRWKFLQSSPVLIFECGAGTNCVRIGIDTGSEHGVWLSPSQWRRFRVQSVPGSSTLEAGWLPADGLVTCEVLRAKKIDIGCITLTNMPVSEAPPSAIHTFSGCDAVLGMFMFARLAVVIDGRNGWLYTKPVTRPFPDYDYNRLGAVFVPRDVEKTDDLIANVIKGSPAYRAGIRDGDILLKVGILNVTKWRIDPTIQLHRFWTQEVGMKLKLTLIRGGKQYETTVMLEELPAVD